MNRKRRKICGIIGGGTVNSQGRKLQLFAEFFPVFVLMGGKSAILGKKSAKVCKILP